MVESKLSRIELLNIWKPSGNIGLDSHHRHSWWFLGSCNSYSGTDLDSSTIWQFSRLILPTSLLVNLSTKHPDHTWWPTSSKSFDVRNNLGIQADTVQELHSSLSLCGWTSCMDINFRIWEHDRFHFITTLYTVWLLDSSFSTALRSCTQGF